MINIFNVTDLLGRSLPMDRDDLLSDVFEHEDVRMLFHESDGVMVSSVLLEQAGLNEPQWKNGQDPRDGTMLVLGASHLNEVGLTNLVSVFEYVVVIDYMQTYIPYVEGLDVIRLQGPQGLQNDLCGAIAEWGTNRPLCILDDVQGRMLMQYGIVHDLYVVMLTQVIGDGGIMFPDGLSLHEVTANRLQGTDIVMYSGRVEVN